MRDWNNRFGATKRLEMLAKLHMFPGGYRSLLELATDLGVTIGSVCRWRDEWRDDYGVLMADGGGVLRVYDWGTVINPVGVVRWLCSGRAYLGARCGAWHGSLGYAPEWLIVAATEIGTYGTINPNGVTIEPPPRAHSSPWQIRTPTANVAPGVRVTSAHVDDDEEGEVPI